MDHAEVKKCRPGEESKATIGKLETKLVEKLIEEEM